MRIVFMGTPEFAAASLKALVESGQYEIAAVVTQPDRPKGRGHKVQMSAVKEYALSRDLPVLQPQRVKTPEFQEEMEKIQPDLIVVAAFGQFLPKSLLDLPKYGCINVHASLLPRYRGAAPIHYAILKGEKEAGVTIMQMAVGMDTGAMLSKVAVPIGPETIPKIVDGTIEPVLQPEAEATYASLITRDMEKLDWTKPATDLHNQIRAFDPWPGSFTLLPDGKRLKLWKSRVQKTEGTRGTPGEILQADAHGFLVACGSGSLEVLECQPEGRKRMPAASFVNGKHVKAGDRLE